MSRDFVDGSWPKPGQIDQTVAAQLTLARSWYRLRKSSGTGWVVEEHRVGEHGEVRSHRCDTHAEAARICRRLSGEGLVGYGVAV